jgi:hypothetical protein
MRCFRDFILGILLNELAGWSKPIAMFLVKTSIQLLPQAMSDEQRKYLEWTWLGINKDVSTPLIALLISIGIMLKALRFRGIYYIRGLAIDKKRITIFLDRMQKFVTSYLVFSAAVMLLVGFANPDVFSVAWVSLRQHMQTLLIAGLVSGGVTWCLYELSDYGEEDTESDIHLIDLDNDF